LCHLNTNGSMVDDEFCDAILQMKLDSLKFSFQGTDEKTYSEMRYGESFNKLVDSVKRIYRMRGTLLYPYIHVATTITYETPEMVAAFKDMISPYCDYVSVGATNLTHISSEQIKLPVEAKVLLDELKSIASIKKEYRVCNEVYDKLSLNWDGTVSACCGDYDNYMIVGNINETSIQEIWKNSSELKRYRSLLTDFKHEMLPLCKNCYDTMNLKASSVKNKGK